MVPPVAFLVAKDNTAYAHAWFTAHSRCVEYLPSL